MKTPGVGVKRGLGAGPVAITGNEQVISVAWPSVSSSAKWDGSRLPHRAVGRLKEERGNAP